MEVTKHLAHPISQVSPRSHLGGFIIEVRSVAQVFSRLCSLSHLPPEYFSMVMLRIVPGTLAACQASTRHVNYHPRTGGLRCTFQLLLGIILHIPFHLSALLSLSYSPSPRWLLWVLLSVGQTHPLFLPVLFCGSPGKGERVCVVCREGSVSLGPPGVWSGHDEIRVLPLLGAEENAKQVALADAELLPQMRLLALTARGVQFLELGQDKEALMDFQHAWHVYPGTPTLAFSLDG